LIKKRNDLKRFVVDPIERYKSTREYNKFQMLKQDIIKARKRRMYALLKETRQAFDNEQAVIDIERQLSGGAVDNDVKKMVMTEENMLPEQIHLLKVLMTLPKSFSLEAEWRRRNQAINAVTVYCRVEEGGSRRGRKPKRLEQNSRQPASKMIIKEAQSTSLLDTTYKHLCQAERPVACFLCYGKLKLSIYRRTKRYNRPQDLTRHFRRDHLNQLKDKESVDCNFCKVRLQHKTHLQNHAHKVHRTHS
jgi:Protein of unknown function (DUF3435)